MSDIAIKVENIGKSYIIGHQSEGQNYVALRDVLTNKTKEWWSRISNPQYHTHQNIEEFWALKDINFEVRQGERLGIIGRNGAGKSTLLKVLSRITEPTAGKVTIKGRVASLLEVGTGFHPELTGRENIFLNGAILGMKRQEIKRKFDEIVDFSGVEIFLDTPVKRYSSGMYVRLAFSVAAHLEPEILLVDEVLAVGDAQFRKKSLGKMKKVSKEGRTVLFVSHNMKAISNLCNSAILLQNGKIAKQGEASSVVDYYLKNSTASATSTGMVDLTDISQNGNNSARIDRIQLMNNGETKGVFDVNEDITVQVDFTNFKEGNMLCYFMHVYDENENIVFTTGNLPSLTPNKDPWFDEPFPAGKFITQCNIQSGYLNTGTYQINFRIQYNVTQHAAISGPVIGFKITDKLKSIKEIHHELSGMIRTKFKWNTIKI